MNTQAAMLAALFEKSLNLGPEWKVVDAEFREVAGGKDELHVFVERATGSAMFCTACGGMHGVYDTREREWRHLDIWQYRTIVHCKVPRVGCPIHGAFPGRPTTPSTSRPCSPPRSSSWRSRG